MDADGNDNAPEWGYCRHPDGCREEALPLWFAGDFPDDPDLRLCQRHIGLHIARLEDLLGIAAAHRSALLTICELVLKDYEAAYIVLAGDMTQERIDCETRIAAIKNALANCELWDGNLTPIARTEADQQPSKAEWGCSRPDEEQTG